MVPAPDEVCYSRVTAAYRAPAVYEYSGLGALEGRRKKLKAPSWVLGACTEREAVGGDSPPGMLSVEFILLV